MISATGKISKAGSHRIKALNNSIFREGNLFLDLIHYSFLFEHLYRNKVPVI